MRMSRLGAFLALLLTAWAIPAMANRAAVATAEAHATAAAEEVLRAGGNAVDAAVAAGFALAVTYPEAGNLGGGGLATVWFEGKAYFLDYRERAPHRATANMYLDAKGDPIPNASTIGARAAGVPGSVAGLYALHQRFGVLSWAQDLAPAITLAGRGFAVPPGLAEGSAEEVKAMQGHTNFADYFRVRTGQRFRQPQLAAVLKRIAAQGPEDFYKGRTADLIVQTMRQDHGLIDHADLADYQPVWRAPLEADTDGYHVITAPPPSSGGIALLQLLGMKSARAADFQGLAPNSADYVHRVAEIEKRVFADRAEYLGDPDFVQVPVAALTDPAYLRARAAEIDPTKPTATANVLPGLKEHHQTTHYSVLDHAGNAVAITYTLNDSFGSGAVVRGAGFLLNNEMDDFSIKPGVPNIYGVVGGDANAIAPGKRPLSSMTPTILTKEGKVALVVGTPGGSRIFTTVFQVVANWRDAGLSLKEAVALPRFHHQLLPDSLIYLESNRYLDAAVMQNLSARGYRFEDQGWSMGDVQAISYTPEHVEAVSDPRGRGASVVIPQERECPCTSR
jgi:gamma-glutamyltranspeptidase/glutathione hydrolase